MRRKGLTLVELLVALTLSGIIVAGAAYFVKGFFSKGFSSRRIALSVSGLQTALSLLRMDIFMSGFAAPSDSLPIEAADNSSSGKDELTLVALYFPTATQDCKWSYILQTYQTPTDQIMIRRWDDPKRDIAKNDRIIILTDNKEMLGNFGILVTDIMEITGPLGKPAYLITLEEAVTTGKHFVFVITQTDSLLRVHWETKGDSLLRNDNLVMTGIEDFQLAYHIDTDGDRVEEAGEWFNDLSPILADPSLADNIRKVRYSLVTAVRGESAYESPDTIVSVENHTYTPDRNFRRYIWSSVAMSRNIR